MPQATVSNYRRQPFVPTLAGHMIATEGMSGAELQATCRGLDYPPVRVRPVCDLQRQPVDETTAHVPARLPRR